MKHLEVLIRMYQNVTGQNPSKSRVSSSQFSWDPVTGVLLHKEKSNDKDSFWYPIMIQLSPNIWMHTNRISLYRRDDSNRCSEIMSSLFGRDSRNVVFDFTSEQGYAYNMNNDRFRILCGLPVKPRQKFSKFGYFQTILEKYGNITERHPFSDALWNWNWYWILTKVAERDQKYTAKTKEVINKFVYNNKFKGINDLHSILVQQAVDDNTPESVESLVGLRGLVSNLWSDFRQSDLPCSYHTNSKMEFIALHKPERNFNIFLQGHMPDKLGGIHLYSNEENRVNWRMVDRWFSLCNPLNLPKVWDQMVGIFKNTRFPIPKPYGLDFNSETMSALCQLHPTSSFSRQNPDKWYAEETGQNNKPEDSTPTSMSSLLA